MAYAVVFRKKECPAPGTEEKKKPKTIFEIPPQKRYILQYYNPSKVFGAPANIRSYLRCCVCKRFSTSSVFECEVEGHLICDLCYQLINVYRCPFQDESGAKCDGPVRKKESAALSAYIRSVLKFPCLNPSCKSILEGAEAWKKHQKKCPHRNFMMCPDENCTNEIATYPKSKFVNHCNKVHGLRPMMGDSFKFCLPLLEKPRPKKNGPLPNEVTTTSPLPPKTITKKGSGLSSSASSVSGPQQDGADRKHSIVALMSSANQLLYYVVEQESPVSFFLSCYTLNRACDKAEKFNVEVTVEMKTEKVSLMKTYMRVNIRHYDMSEAKQFGRGVRITLPKCEDDLGEDLAKLEPKVVVACKLVDSSSISPYHFFPMWLPIPKTSRSSKWKPLSSEEIKELQKYCHKALSSSKPGTELESGPKKAEKDMKNDLEQPQPSNGYQNKSPPKPPTPTEQKILPPPPPPNQEEEETECENENEEEEEVKEYQEFSLKFESGKVLSCRIVQLDPADKLMEHVQFTP